MSIKFTPGPHPSAQQRNSSSSSLPTRQPSSVPSPHPRQVSSSSISSSHSNGVHETAYGAPEDPERQPLIPTRDLNRNRVFYPIAVGVLFVILFGLVVGFGGWRLGQGEGGGRWPGGPH